MVITRERARSPPAWSHTPSTFTLVWLFISLPLVIWDTGYVLLRPHSMPGGKWHAPIWTAYELYGTIDHVYGFPAWDKHEGFAGAQGTLNALETLMYGIYLYIAYSHGVAEVGKMGRGSPGILGRRKIAGREAGIAVLIGFSAAVMTLSKTVLYWLNEYYSGFSNIGHNTLQQVVFLWIIPNSAWLVAPSYMIYVYGAEILQGLEQAAGSTRKKSE
ncbi:hypothetical protein BLS_001251 [Venturia inaequalis]|uniref:C6 transcription factor n=1 Tax=Venturia inaequalis TaxID=5025 RepID=A0A8H3UYB3_VENIN|nr:hypothetical protein EG328_003474 [Venturia inaequalis]KAE9977631.1 hypothetical protein BLS_001251 [Venturia inaequalis]